MKKIVYGWKGRIYYLFNAPDSKPVERRKKFTPTEVCHPFCLEMEMHTAECRERQNIEQIHREAQPTGDQE